MLFHLNLLPVKHPNEMPSYWKREWRTIFLVTVSGLIFDGGMSLVPLFQGKLLDSVIDKESVANILIRAAYFLGIVVLLQLMRAVKRYGVREFANQTGAVMRMEIYHNILHRRFDELIQEEAGDLLNKAVNDVDLCAEGMRKVTTEFFDSGVLMTGYLIALLCYDWKMTIPAVFFIFLAMFIANRLKGTIVKYNKSAREQSSKVANLTYNNVEHIALYRINSIMDTRQREYSNELHILEDKSVRASVFENVMLPVYNVISMLSIGVILFMEGLAVIEGRWTVGVFTAYVATFTAFSIKASKASQLFNSFQKATVSWKRLKPYFTENAESELKIEELSKTSDTAKLQVRDMKFSYPETDKVLLENVNFQTEQGQIIGVTGTVACGKSTLGIALTGAYDYKGSICINGREMKNLSSAQRSKLISYQGHAPLLLSDTIKENITLGKDGDISDVLKTVCFKTDLQSMPEGIQTVVGTNGVRLSGGQQARLAMARALWQESPVVILDDPFSAVDTTTEQTIMNNLRDKYKDRIFIIMSHRLTQFPSFDQILYLDEGQVCSGTHEELMERVDNYAKLYRMQTGGDGNE